VLHVVPDLTNNGLQIRAEQCCAPKSTDYHYEFSIEIASQIAVKTARVARAMSVLLW